MKRFLAAVFLMGLAFINAQYFGTNTGFDNWQTNAAGYEVPTAWTVENPQYISKVPGRSGTGYALAVKATPGQSVVIRQEHLPLQAGKHYSGEFWAKNTSSIAKVKIGAYLDFKTGGSVFNNMGYDFYTQVHSDWHYYEPDTYIDIVIPPGNELSDAEANYRMVVTITYDAAGTGTDDMVYLDDLLIWEYGTLSTREAHQINDRIKFSNTLVTDVFTVWTPGKTRIGILDLTGKTLETKDFTGSATFDISRYPKGVYLVNIVCGGLITQKKIIKK